MSALKNLKLYYFTVVQGSTTMGRGENIRLLLEDAGVDFEYIRYNAAQWQEEKQKLLDQNIRNPTMPFITIDGKYYGKTAPLLRFLSHKLGKYEGDNEDEFQLLDVYTDMANDWVGRWVKTVFGNPSEETVKTYREETAPQTFKTWDDILSDTKGPFLLGEKISYADFTLFHMLEDDTTIKVCAETYPHLSAFVEAVNNRPNLKKYLATDRK
ncbi:glutathione S-transferase [Thamnidium elegans]|uniref:Glutathione S-transferase n=1 Tax=Thamnidium elegans TaxID=101142 RepID=A0A8H7SU62_9FUNG|nr:hypothetical protein INT48_000458 [Thamnidium elegans]KAI8094283.1 glutathione S-transferase [Thamnidium elegans]